MKIKVTIMCGETEELPRCSDLLDSCPEILILAQQGGLNEAGIWLALERSDILILDETVLAQQGAAAIRDLQTGRPPIRSLLIMNNDNKNNILSALSLGISGVITRESLPYALSRALAAIYSGDAWVSRGLAEPLMDELIYMERQAHRARYPAGHPGFDKLN